eukprot:scaffold3349_cov246-Pinguiococcus_pyrenoidosus.AAC.6
MRKSALFCDAGDFKDMEGVLWLPVIGGFVMCAMAFTIGGNDVRLSGAWRRRKRGRAKRPYLGLMLRWRMRGERRLDREPSVCASLRSSQVRTGMAVATAAAAPNAHTVVGTKRVSNWLGAVTLGTGVSEEILQGVSDIEDPDCWACGYCDSKMSVFYVGMFSALIAASVRTRASCVADVGCVSHLVVVAMP